MTAVLHSACIHWSSVEEQSAQSEDPLKAKIGGPHIVLIPNHSASFVCSLHWLPGARPVTVPRYSLAGILQLSR